MHQRQMLEHSGSLEDSCLGEAVLFSSTWSQHAPRDHDAIVTAHEFVFLGSRVIAMLGPVYLHFWVPKRRPTLVGPSAAVQVVGLPAHFR